MKTQRNNQRNTDTKYWVVWFMFVTILILSLLVKKWELEKTKEMIKKEITQTENQKPAS